MIHSTGGSGPLSQPLAVAPPLSKSQPALTQADKLAGGVVSSVATTFELMNDLSYMKGFTRPKTHATKAKELGVSRKL